MPPPSRALRSGIQGCPASPPAEKELSVELKPAGVDRKAATSKGDVLVGDVESEHATAVITVAATRIRKVGRIMFSFSDRLASNDPGQAHIALVGPLPGANVKARQRRGGTRP
jgi:sorbitol-specific phosphotransferase system component IIA